MPHLIIEFTDNIDDKSIMQCLADANEALADSGHFDEADIKSRARPVSLYRVGAQPRTRGFAAAKLSLLSGRDEEVKRDLANRVMQSMLRSFPGSSALTVQLSVEVVDIDRSSYAKSIVKA